MAKLIQLPARGPKKARSGELHIGVVIQARMGSKRFPGKVTAKLAGKPVIEYVIERAKLIKSMHKLSVIVAVPDEERSEDILYYADKLKILNFLGSESNVLDRYYQCAKHHKLDVIMRITADCPFIDPIVCEECLTLLLWRKLDYVSNVFPNRTYPQGLDCEVFTMDCLEAAWLTNKEWLDKIGLDSNLKDTGRGGILVGKDIFLYNAEHVTPWMQKTEGINRACVSQKINKSKLNWCVDLPEDIKHLEESINSRKLKIAVNNDKTT